MRHVLSAHRVRSGLDLSGLTCLQWCVLWLATARPEPEGELGSGFLSLVLSAQSAHRHHDGGHLRCALLGGLPAGLGNRGESELDGLFATASLFRQALSSISSAEAPLVGPGVFRFAQFHIRLWILDWHLTWPENAIACCVLFFWGIGTCVVSIKVTNQRQGMRCCCTLPDAP